MASLCSALDMAVSYVFSFKHMYSDMVYVRGGSQIMRLSALNTVINTNVLGWGYMYYM